MTTETQIAATGAPTAAIAPAPSAGQPAANAKANPPAKKPAKAKATAAKPRPPAVKLPPVGSVPRPTEDQKIAWLGKANPFQPDTKIWKRYEAVRAHNGKLVSTFQAAKGNMTTLRRAVVMKLAAVK